MSNPTIDIVILNYNTIDVVKECLPQVIENTRYPGAQVVFVDNNSTDGSADWVETTYGEQIELIKLKKNNGFAGGYNEALENRTADYFVLLNSDATPKQKRWLKPLVDLLEGNPNIAAAQPKILSYRDHDKFEYAGAAGGFIDYLGFPFCKGRIFGDVELDKDQYNDSTPIFWASGAAMFIRRTSWQQAKGLDESFFAHMEEIDLCWRLKNLGHEIYSCPESVVYHIGGATLSNQNPRKTFLNFRNGLLMMYKNLPDSIREKRIFQRKLLDGLAGIKFFFEGQTKHTVQIIRAHKEFKELKKNIKTSSNAPLLVEHSGVLPHSIVWGYFFRNKKTWSSWYKKK